MSCEPPSSVSSDKTGAVVTGKLVVEFVGPDPQYVGLAQPSPHRQQRLALKRNDDGESPSKCDGKTYVRTASVNKRLKKGGLPAIDKPAGIAGFLNRLRRRSDSETYRPADGQPPTHANVEARSPTFGPTLTPSFGRSSAFDHRFKAPL